MNFGRIFSFVQMNLQTKAIQLGLCNAVVNFFHNRLCRGQSFCRCWPNWHADTHNCRYTPLIPTASSISSAKVSMRPCVSAYDTSSSYPCSGRRHARTLPTGTWRSKRTWQARTWATRYYVHRCSLKYLGDQQPLSPMARGAARPASGGRTSLTRVTSPMWRESLCWMPKGSNPNAPIT